MHSAALSQHCGTGKYKKLLGKSSWVNSLMNHTLWRKYYQNTAADALQSLRLQKILDFYKTSAKGTEQRCWVWRKLWFKSIFFFKLPTKSQTQFILCSWESALCLSPHLWDAVGLNFILRVWQPGPGSPEQMRSRSWRPWRSIFCQPCKSRAGRRSPSSAFKSHFTHVMPWDGYLEQRPDKIKRIKVDIY